MMPIKIAIVIAAYNEEANIKDLTLRIDKVMKASKIPYELVYMIEGTDDTINIVRELEKTLPIRSFYAEKPQGLGYAFKNGFTVVSQNVTHVLTMDADLNHQPEDIPLFIKEIKKNNPDIIIGSRHVQNAVQVNVAWWKSLVSQLANVVFDLITKIPIKDKTSGFRLYKREVIKEIYPLMTSRNFEFLMEILLIAVAKKYTMTEIPITFIYRVHGKSKMNLFKTAKGYARLLKYALFGGVMKK